ncbi:Translation initiation factor 3 subunit J component [Paramarasmius palmivorus]|uniref:Eukaryotic translation initiation factor 3 subunit J n=1 Tax=Paramarasmius palmivorus TaxID=297713 RepID=A0AAW0C0Z4_9AGAR
MSDWEASEDEKVTSPPPKVAPPKTKGKWDGEDEDDNGPASDWEDSSEEEEKPAPAAAAPPKKKGTLKQKLAEKEAAKAAKKDEDDAYDSDAVLDPREKARRDKEKELNADLNNAADLFGAAALGGTSSKELDSLISFQPRTKEDFIELSSRIIEFVVKRHQGKPLYAAFVEHHVRELAQPLKDVEVRKAASGLTTLANEKQKAQERCSQREKEGEGVVKTWSGCRKGFKQTLTDRWDRLDTNVYDEALDDFGSHPDDFM